MHEKLAILWRKRYSFLTKKTYFCKQKINMKENPIEQRELPAKIEELKKLMCIPFDATDIKERFKKIAEILKNNCVIQYESKEYRIIDFEFYFYNKNHQDITVHPRKSEAMCWYINDFGGIDLNFESNIEPEIVPKGKKWSLKYKLTDKSFFGGILIRQIQEINGEERVLDGPLKVAELFRKLDAATQHQRTPILAIKRLEPLDFVVEQRYNLLGKHTAKEKADYILQSCFLKESYSTKQSILEKKLEKEFNESPYRYWVRKP